MFFSRKSKAYLAQLGWGAALLLALPALAEAAQESCPTLLPDFRCDREARPPSSSMPMSMPYLFEDPYITSGVNLVGIWHDFPDQSVFRGGKAGVLALQARLAITQWLAFIATKDGYTVMRPETLQSDLPIAGLPDAPLLGDEEGFYDITVGFKAKVFDRGGFVFSPAFRYEIPLGEEHLFQDQGDGVFILSGSGAFNKDNWNLIAGIGGQIPVDRDANSTSMFYNLHVDHAFPVDVSVLRFITPFIEVSGMHWTDSGDGMNLIETTVGPVTLQTAQNLLGTGAFEGADVANLGSAGIDGADLVTMAWGVRLPMKGGVDLGVSYERAISNRKDIFEQRVSVMMNWEF